MKLNLILIILSLQAFLSAALGGYLYYSSLKEAAYNEAERQVISRVETINQTLSSLMAEYEKPVRVISRMEQLKKSLTSRMKLRTARGYLKESKVAINTIDNSREILAQIRNLLDTARIETRKSDAQVFDLLKVYNNALFTDACFLIDIYGNIVASSNRGTTKSNIGNNRIFRPYFQKAITGQPSTYLALDTQSMNRSIFFSHPVYESDDSAPIGVAVIKTSIEAAAIDLITEPGEIILVADPNGIIFISSRKDWIMQSIWKLPPEKLTRIAASRQFGVGPWKWIGWDIGDRNIALSNTGEPYYIYQADIENYPGWNVIHLRSIKTISDKISAPLLKITRPLILALCLLTGFTVFLLYRKAHIEIKIRRSAEDALRKSEERYRNIYNKTPAMLHSIDKDNVLLSVSDYWVKAMGYQKREVIGKKYTDFLTPESREEIEKKHIPGLNSKGYYKDVPCRFVKKTGDIIDVLLSGIAELDSDENIKRSLAVSIDISQRKKTEEDLKQAQIKLSNYAKDLEIEVSKRTREISSIFEYTPAVIYMKNKNLEYLMVNSRYEELFNLKNSDIIGKKDVDLFDDHTAGVLNSSDYDVLETEQPVQVEDRLTIMKKTRSFLSVKFPIYDETGNIRGICCISTDMTALRHAREKLKRLSRNIIKSQEKERAYISKELHDQLGQMMTVLKMDAVWLEKRLKDIDKKAHKRTVGIRNLVDDTIQEVRNLAFRLRPGILDDLGLIEALELLTSDFEKRSETACVFEHKNVPLLKDEIATAVYRIVQESVTNAVRHAKASRIKVIIEVVENKLITCIADDGCGFEISEDQSMNSQGFGMAGMYERANLVGGTLIITSTRREGTLVNCFIPLKEKHPLAVTI